MGRLQSIQLWANSWSREIGECRGSIRAREFDGRSGAHGRNFLWCWRSAEVERRDGSQGAPYGTVLDGAHLFREAKDLGAVYEFVLAGTVDDMEVIGPAARAGEEFAFYDYAAIIVDADYVAVEDGPVVHRQARFHGAGRDSIR